MRTRGGAMLTRRRAFSIIGAASAIGLVDANGKGSTRMPHPRDSAAIEAAIVVDSAASLPDGFRDAPNAFIAPMLLHVGDDSYRDGVDLTPAAFYEMQRRSPVATNVRAHARELPSSVSAGARSGGRRAVRNRRRRVQRVARLGGDGSLAPTV